MKKRSPLMLTISDLRGGSWLDRTIQLNPSKGWGAHCVEWFALPAGAASVYPAPPQFTGDLRSRHGSGDPHQDVACGRVLRERHVFLANCIGKLRINRRLNFWSVVLKAPDGESTCSEDQALGKSAAVLCQSKCLFVLFASDADNGGVFLSASKFP